MAHWLSGFVYSPGFGGLAAVVAATIAYAAAVSNARAQNERADEDRWWDQARWATRLLAGEDSDVAIGIGTLRFLMDRAPDSQAAAFVNSAVMPVVGADRAPVDAPADGDSDLDAGRGSGNGNWE